jgi:phosphotriesterase-related protein
VRDHKLQQNTIEGEAAIEMTTVRTVLGDITAASLGTVDYHEHLFQTTPLLPGDELNDESASSAEAAMLLAAGVTAMVDATPIGLGRRPAALASISRTTGLKIVATTGAHREAHYGAGHWLTACSVEQLARRFVADVLQGMEGADSSADVIATGASASTSSELMVKAGVVKVGVGYWSISDFERRVLEAAGSCHAQTGAPVMVHLEHGSAAFEVLALLANFDVPSDAVVLAHMDRNPDPGLHTELAAQGAYLGYDGMARSKSWPDSVVLECLLRTAENGASDRILLGGDVARSTRFIAYGGMPGMAYLPDRFLPRLARAAPPGLVDHIMSVNPARWLGRFPSSGSTSAPGS